MGINLKKAMPKEEKINIDVDTWASMEYSDILYIISKCVRDYRERYNLNQKQLAQKVNMSQPMISKIESGEYNPSVEFLVKLWNKFSTDEENFGKILLTCICDRVEQNYNYIVKIKYSSDEKNEYNMIKKSSVKTIEKGIYNIQYEDENDIIKIAS